MSLDISNKLSWYIIQYSKALALTAGDAPIPEHEILTKAEDVLTSLNAMVAWVKATQAANNK